MCRFCKAPNTMDPEKDLFWPKASAYQRDGRATSLNENGTCKGKDPLTACPGKTN